MTDMTPKELTDFRDQFCTLIKEAWTKAQITQLWQQHSLVILTTEELLEVSRKCRAKPYFIKAISRHQKIWYVDAGRRFAQVSQTYQDFWLCPRLKLMLLKTHSIQLENTRLHTPDRCWSSYQRLKLEEVLQIMENNRQQLAKKP